MIPLSPKAASRIALPWIVRLRYAMAGGQLATAILVDRLLHIDLPLAWIAIPPSLVMLSNLWLWRRWGGEESVDSPVESTLISWMFVLDTLCLTAVLMLTGGSSNPFSLLYLVHITLSATILNRRQTWTLGLLATVCFGLLFRAYLPIAALEMHPRGEGVNLHLAGMWVGFAVASLLITMFSGRISEQLREHERSLLNMQEQLAKKERLASLVTLAAGAAHELSTPLATIAVVARELERFASLTPGSSAVSEDSRLIRTEVERCRGILERMSVEGAEPAGEAIAPVPVEELLAEVRDAFPRGSLLVTLQAGNPPLSIPIPRHAVQQALIALVKNGIEASQGGRPVSLSVSECGDAVRFAVKDSGCGMSAETLRHAGEPFFSTKDPGKGMGLGVFLVRTLADRMGGRFVLQSSPGAGTSAILELPACIARERVAG